MRRFVVVCTLALLALSGCSSTPQKAATPTPPKAADVETAGIERAGWTADGAYAWIQDFERDGTPVVSAVDVASRAKVSQRGYLLVAAETSAPVLWLMPADRSFVSSALADPAAKSIAYPVVVRWPYDAPVPGLKVWDLSSDGGPVDASGGSWAPWAGAKGGPSVELAVDATRGGWPASIAVAGRSVALPGASATYRPVGFSRSGTLFALEELTAVPASAHDPQTKTRHVVVVDTRSGATRSFALPQDISSPVVWDGGSEALAWAQMRSTDSTPTYSLITMDPVRGSTRTLATEKFVAKSVGADRPLVLLGSDSSGLIALAGDSFADPSARVWRFNASGAAEIGALPRVTRPPGFDPARGLVYLVQEPSTTAPGMVHAVASVRALGSSESTRIYEGADKPSPQ